MPISLRYTKNGYIGSYVQNNVRYLHLYITSVHKKNEDAFTLNDIKGIKSV